MIEQARPVTRKMRMRRPLMSFVLLRATLWAALGLAAPAHADEHLDAISVLFGLEQPQPVDWWVDAGEDAKSGYANDGTMRISMILSLQRKDRCQVNLVTLMEFGPFPLFQSSQINLRRATGIKFVRDYFADNRTTRADPGVIKARILGDDLVCTRLLMGGAAEPAAERMCEGEADVEWRDEPERKLVMAALDTVHKTCPLPGLQP